MYSLRQKWAPALAIIVVFFLVYYSIPVWLAWPDSNETYTVVNTLVFGATKSLKPSAELTYGTVFPYILFGFYGLTYIVGYLAGNYQNPYDFAYTFFLNPELFYAIGRILSALFGIATLVMVYHLGSRFFNKRIGLIASLLVFFNNVFFLRSHLVTIETTLTFFVLIFIYILFRLLEKSATRYFILGGLVYGLILATKMTGVFVAVGLPVAYSLAGDQIKINKRVILQFIFFGCASLAIFFMLHPYFFIDFDHYFSLLLREKDKGLHLARGMETYPYIWFFTRSLLDNSILGFIYLCGIFSGFIIRRKMNWVLYSVIFTYILMIGNQQLHYMHFMLPILPLVALLSAQFIDRLFWRANLPVLKYVGCSIIAILAIYSSHDLWSRTAPRMKPSVQTTAAGWIETHIPAEKIIAIDDYEKGPSILTTERYFSGDRLQNYINYLPDNFKKGLIQKISMMKSYATIRVKYYLSEPKWPMAFTKEQIQEMSGKLFWERRYKAVYRNIANLEDLGAEYLILANLHIFESSNFRNEQPQESLLHDAVQREVDFYKDVYHSKRLKRIKTFSTDRECIVVYKMKQNLAASTEHFGSNTIMRSRVIGAHIK